MNCGAKVEPLTNGSYRNHCPFCLYSVHIDLLPGDRANDCHGLLRPIGVKNSTQKGMQIIFKCQKCNTIRMNKVAVDNVQSDDINELIKLL